ncbi:MULTISPECIES: phage regulatory protein/antirepressor Ant [unclassified Lactobacillus]|uniref:phage regulatory protein/antirepressor Ant n=1 Tax=unclassified Lactobacillus TaxID=2620435 RepID=UPI000EFA43EA|nr:MULTISPECIES: phage regulatory protein/antirepressor Ant [unclassified Lactobacillus]RMC24459.1 Rha family transcriptional regulator [Lactobacillus sp. ESL0247]RMC28598.1 Rha family transcriptional regulator [Lactobacillus sp. ESL0246]RMC31790.1 Rha family transcriptional regulator [Lactobacillus sp. ESL0245]
MQELVIMQNQQAVTSSLQVAKTFGKNHRDVLRIIDGFKKDVRDFAQIFEEGNEPDSYGRKRRAYFMTRDGFTLLAMGFTGKKALNFKLKYINAFNQMENEIKAIKAGHLDSYMIEDPVKRAQKWVEEKKAYLKIKPKADYYDSQMHNPGLMTTTEIAKDYGWTAKKLNIELHNRHVIYKQGKVWVLYRKYDAKGYTQYEPYSYAKDGKKDQGVHNNLKWTQKGKKFIYDLLAEDNIHPVLEQMDLLEV